jgi:hypothetical protein
MICGSPRPTATTARSRLILEVLLEEVERPSPRFLRGFRMIAPEDRSSESDPAAMRAVKIVKSQVQVKKKNTGP